VSGRVPRDEPGAWHDVVVEEQHDLARRALGAGLARRGDAEVRALDHDEPVVVARAIGEPLLRPVGRPVDHDDELVHRLVAEQALDGLLERVPALIRGDHDRDGRRHGRRAGHRLRPPTVSA
jgi:hypothetical protein